MGLCLSTGEIPSRLEGVSLEEAVEQTGYLMRESIRKRTSGKHRIGVYLSGGLDSRTIAGLAAKESIPFVTLSLFNIWLNLW